MNNTQEANTRIVPMRLQKFLARAGVASRRGSENLMTAGRVTVNGVVTTELGSKVDPLVDVVCVDNVEVHLESGSVYLMLNKPEGYLTTMSDPQGRPTVAELVPTDLYPGLFPVGRLDLDTTGLLLFTTDGELAQHLLHPSFEKNKCYLVHIDGELSKDAYTAFEEGIELEDGICAPAKVERKALGEYTLTIHEGKKHQVKRMFASVGHKVLRLHRLTFDCLNLGNLGIGEWRMLTEEEIAQLKAL